MAESNSPPPAKRMAPTPSQPLKKKRRSLWVPVVVIGMALAVGFELINAINEQATLSPTLMMSMFVTTIPLLIVVVVGISLVVKGKPRSST